MMGSGRRAVVLVSNDLSFDQRVRKTVATLEGEGWTVNVWGRKLPDSVEVGWTNRAQRVTLPFHRGAAFYAALQVAFFLRLLFGRRPDLIWANDLDTLLPAHAVGVLRRVPVVYDSHEFFTEAEGLTGRPFQRGVWLALERWLMPRQRAVITVNEGIADAYAERYPRARFGRPLVVRNMPVKREAPVAPDRNRWAAHAVPIDQPIALLQGAFMDRDRGAKLAVEALAYGEGWRLVLVGAGPEFDWACTQQGRWAGRLHCLPRMPFEALAGLTASADVGLSLDLGHHGNFYLSLPNKLFDYIHARIPVIATPMPEVQRVVSFYGLGQILPEATPSALAQALATLLKTPTSDWRQQCEQAAEQLHWGTDAMNIRTAVTLAVQKKPDLAKDSAC